MKVLGQPASQPFKSDLAVPELRPGVGRRDDNACGKVLQADGRVGAVPVLSTWPRGLVDGHLDLSLELLEIGVAGCLGIVVTHGLTTHSVALGKGVGQWGSKAVRQRGNVARDHDLIGRPALM